MARAKSQHPGEAGRAEMKPKVFPVCRHDFVAQSCSFCFLEENPDQPYSELDCSFIYRNKIRPPSPKRIKMVTIDSDGEVETEELSVPGGSKQNRKRSESPEIFHSISRIARPTRRRTLKNADAYAISEDDDEKTKAEKLMRQREAKMVVRDNLRWRKECLIKEILDIRMRMKQRDAAPRDDDDEEEEEEEMEEDGDELDEEEASDEDDPAWNEKIDS